MSVTDVPLPFLLGLVTLLAIVVHRETELLAPYVYPLVGCIIPALAVFGEWVLTLRSSPWTSDSDGWFILAYMMAGYLSFLLILGCVHYGMVLVSGRYLAHIGVTTRSTVLGAVIGIISGCFLLDTPLLALLQLIICIVSGWFMGVFMHKTSRSDKVPQ